MSVVIDKIKELIPGTPEYETLRKSREKSQAVLQKWEDGETVYNQIFSRVDSNRSFYIGENKQLFNSSTHEGEMKIPVNIGATVLDLIVFILSNNPPNIQFLPDSSSRLSQLEASISEDLVDRALDDAGFRKKFRDTCRMLLLAGFSWWYPFWNNSKKFGKKKNHFDFTLLNPFTTRVFYETTDYQMVSSFITMKRMTPELIYDIYEGFEASTDSENPWLPKSIIGVGLEEGKTTVFTEYDKKYATTVIDNRIADQYEHGFDFCPLIQTNNIWMFNDAHGHDEIERWKPIAQELNTLITAASEIARDLAWPPILEYNKALGGKKISKWRGVKIPVRRTDRGEAVEFMINPAQIEPLLKQIQMLLELFHFVSLMPKAAAGIFEASITSGFQAKLAMQPATLSAENKKIDLEESIKELVKTALYLIEKNDKEALKVELGNGKTAELKELFDSRMKVVWPENLPVDISREIQNLILGIQNSLTSVTQAIDKYNVLMGMQSPEDTRDYLKQEAEEADINPDRSLKVAKVREVLNNIQTSLASISQKVGGGLPQELIPPDQTQMNEMGNMNNMAKRMDNRTPEEKRPSPQTAREAVTPESAGGQVLPNI